MKKIVIFASGTGSNALKIIEHFKKKSVGKVVLVVSNKKNAAVLDKAQQHNIPTLIINRTSFYKSESFLEVLKEYEADLLVLAGFLWLVPAYLVKAYPQKIVNIHPALLPKFGGKGMYGMNVHRAVYEAKETQTGITIHYVNEQYDEGAIIFQATCALTPEDLPEDISSKIRVLEHGNFPRIIEEIVKNYKLE